MRRSTAQVSLAADQQAHKEMGCWSGRSTLSAVGQELQVAHTGPWTALLNSSPQSKLGHKRHNNSCAAGLFIALPTAWSEGGNKHSSHAGAHTTHEVSFKLTELTEVVVPPEIDSRRHPRMKLHHMLKDHSTAVALPAWVPQIPINIASEPQHKRG